MDCLELPGEQCDSDAGMAQSVSVQLEIHSDNHSSGSSNSTNTSTSSSLGLSLLQDTKLVVLHYISTTCSSTSSSLAATPSPLANHTSAFIPSPIYSLECNNTGKRIRVREGVSQSDSEHCRRKRLLRPRFHSSPAISRAHMLSSRNTPERCPCGNECACTHQSGNMVDAPGLTCSGIGGDLCSCHCHGRRRTRRPSLKLDIRAAQMYAASKNISDSNNDEFSYVTPEERLRFDIANEVSQTLNGLNDAISDGMIFTGTPHTKIANFLKIIGDKYDEDIRRAMERALQQQPLNDRQPFVDYAQFEQIMELIADSLTVVSWNRIALVLRLANELVAYLLRQGYSGLTFLADYTTRFLFDRAAGFLIRNGGWGTVANLSPTNPLFTSPSPSSQSSSSSPGLRGNSLNNRYSSDKRARFRARPHPLRVVKSTTLGHGARPKTLIPKSISPSGFSNRSNTNVAAKSNSDTYLALPVERHSTATFSRQQNGSSASNRLTPKSLRNSPDYKTSIFGDANQSTENGAAGDHMPTLKLIEFNSDTENSPGSSLSCLESDTSERSILDTPCSNSSISSNDARSN